MRRTTAAKRFEISIDGQLFKDVERAAKAESDGNVSEWLAGAARLRLQQLAANKVLRRFEAEAGAITDDEIVEVRRLWPRG
jgi:hypothetical protein